jgi:hypothetical protein
MCRLVVAVLLFPYILRTVQGINTLEAIDMRPMLTTFYSRG